MKTYKVTVTLEPDDTYTWASVDPALKDARFDSCAFIYKVRAKYAFNAHNEGLDRFHGNIPIANLEAAYITVTVKEV